MKTLIYNGNIILKDRIISGGTIIIENGVIKEISKHSEKKYNGILIDAERNYISPGFIDMHVHGGGGFDFMDSTKDAYKAIAKTHAKFGTTAMVPTTVSSSEEELATTLDAYNRAKNDNEFGAEFLGLHFEGPYFSTEYGGAQDVRYIKNPTFSEYSKILDMTPEIVIWSAAPELEGSLEFAKFISKKGIIPSIAHTAALYDDVEKAIKAGFRHVTHLYSCMRGIHRIQSKKYAGCIEAALYEDDLSVEIIADGMHLPCELLRYVYKFKGADKTALVTDAMRAAGTDLKKSVLGSLKDGQEVIIENGVAMLANSGNFAGSIATCDRLVRNMVKLANVPLVDSVKMMSLTPAQILGISSKKGSLEAKKDADILIFDDNVNIKMTMIKGRIVYQN